jgi:hypothetical protein
MELEGVRMDELTNEVCVIKKRFEGPGPKELHQQGETKKE